MLLVNVRQFVVFVAVSLLIFAFGSSESRSSEPDPDRLYTLLEQGIQQGKVAGAQVAVGQGKSPIVARSFGVRDTQTRIPVDNKTRFCIGSCSKMFAGAVLASLAADKTVDLDRPIDHWLEAFAQPKLTDGTAASRPPTLRELLCHRGGMYSQRDRLTKDQVKWIRDFTLTLAASVDGIAGERLTTDPGSKYAYSGAGYCVLGRVAEVAADMPFEELLQSRICAPLKLSRTSYFPPADDDNIASGHATRERKLVVVQESPHRLKSKLQLPLVGGSIYAPASEAAEFARMLLHEGKANGDEVLSKEAWTAMTTPCVPNANGGYGFGILIKSATDDGITSLQHGGALLGSFSFIAINFRTKRFGVVTYTGQQNQAINEALATWVASSGGD